MSSTEDRLTALEGKVAHIEEQIGALETDVKRFKEATPVGKEGKETASTSEAPAESGPSSG